MPPESNISPAKPSGKKKSFGPDLAFVIIGLLFAVSWYFYSPQITAFSQSLADGYEEVYVQYKAMLVNSWDMLADGVTLLGASAEELAVGSWNWVAGGFDKGKEVVQAPESNVQSQSPGGNLAANTSEKNCGSAAAPDPSDSKTYQNNQVFSCLGQSALRCENARAALEDPLFPTVFQIVRNSATGACNFKLSYKADSALTDVTGKKLAGQYVTCPVGIVKRINESGSALTFSAPSAGNPSRYAAEIYQYGTIGLFLEQNVDKGEILGLGCSGSYIDSVVASYQKTQSR